MKDYANFLEQMQQSYEQLAGMRADDASDVGIRFKILAEQLSKIKEELEFAKQQSFPQTATGENLEMHALERGIFRKQATRAKGTVRFSRESAASEDILIPQGIFLTCSQTEGNHGTDIRFVTTSEVTLRQGQTSVDAPVECQTEGSRGNLAAGILNVMITRGPGTGRRRGP